jgi:hypothetical protein
MKLPRNVCVLDIETFGIKRKNVEETPLAFAGVKRYAVTSSRYRPMNHQVFTPSQLPALESFLKEFDGVIVGHRLFHFDYRVLASSICLKGVIEKSVDTRFALQAHIDRETPQWSFYCPGLDRLCRLNFKTRKTIEPKLLGSMLRDAERHMSDKPVRGELSDEAMMAVSQFLPRFRFRQSDRDRIVPMKLRDGRLARVTRLPDFHVYISKRGRPMLIPPERRSPAKGKAIMRKVIRYNENDCDMTMQLWWALVRGKPMKVPCSVLAISEHFLDADPEDENARPARNEFIIPYRMAPQDAAALFSTPPFTFETWTNTLRERNGIEAKRGKKIYCEGNKFLFAPCPKCGSRSLQKFDELRDGCGVDGMTEGQLAEYLAGNWGTLICSKCSHSFDFGD